MTRSEGIQWTNESVLRLAGNEDPVAVIERLAREVVLRARDKGWQGPPFNPVAIADLLDIPLEPNADVADARTITIDGRLRIQFNPTQPRERVRFSIAHEIAHTLFPDVAAQVRHRSPSRSGDEWQLEMLCNIAASEFVMPAGSLSAHEPLPQIEPLMLERRRFDVSAEAFLIRVAKVAKEPVIMFCASAVTSDEQELKYRIDYAIPSQSAPQFSLAGRIVPSDSGVYSCTAIGYTERRKENWFAREALRIECVGIPGYPGTRLPRVAGLMRFPTSQPADEPIKFVHGNVLEPRGQGTKVVCQLVNDQARTWGGGLAKTTASKFPEAQREFSGWLASLERTERLGRVHFFKATSSLFIASLVGQHGFGASETPRIRYEALERCFESVSDFVSKHSASVHLPRIGVGASGGSWDTVEEIIRYTLVADGAKVTVYDLPPKREAGTPELFD